MPCPLRDSVLQNTGLAAMIVVVKLWFVFTVAHLINLGRNNAGGGFSWASTSFAEGR